MTTKIHALVDALGNPVGCSARARHDDLRQPLIEAVDPGALIADKAFDADARVLEPLAKAGKTAVIPP